MKKALSIILSLVMVLVALPFTAIESIALTDGDWEYTVSNNEATVTGYTGSLTDITIPSTLGGYDVTAIGNNAFKSKTSLTGVTLPNTLVSIGEYAFSDCTNIVTMQIPSTVRSIGQYAFNNCKKITSISFPNGMSELNRYICYGCSELLSVSIPQSWKDACVR